MAQPDTGRLKFKQTHTGGVVSASTAAFITAIAIASRQAV